VTERDDPMQTLRKLLLQLAAEPLVPKKGKAISVALQTALDELEQRQYDVIVAVLAINMHTASLDRDLVKRLRSYLDG
jgi:hypothetical protein